MLNCNTCIIGISFLLASIYTTMRGFNKQLFVDFDNLLDESQKQIYHTIVKERIKIYSIAVFMGILTAFLYWYRNRNQPYIICTFLAIGYITKLLVYYLYPKSPLMLYSLTTKEQTDAWADIYTEMKTRYRTSLVIGFIGYVIISLGLK